MELISGNVCSVCTKIFCSSKRKIAVENVPQLLKFLFTKVNCLPLQNIQICETCLENIHAAYNFKMLHLEKKTHYVATTKMEKMDMEICICQICKEIIKKSSSVSYTKELKFVIYHLIEGTRVGLEATEDSHICISCRKSVVNFHSIIKLLSNLDEECISNVESDNESLDIENKSEIKKERLMEYPDIANENLVVKNEPVEIENIKCDIKTESTYDNEINVAYEDFSKKNEQVDIKSECEENDFIEQAWKVSEDHNIINPSNVVAQHFVVDHKNNKKASRPLETYHPCDIRKFSCNVCDYKAKRKWHLKSHMLRHKNIDEIKMFRCDVCGHKTKRKSNLENHMLQHKKVDEIQMFTCDICEYKTKYKGYLKIHILQHKNVDEIKMFACDICEYKTKQNRNLKNHMLRHKNIDEINIFTCSLCGYKSKLNRSLKRHMLIHKNVDEVEMFACNFCSHTTKHKSNLKDHMLQHKIVDEREMFTCDVCGYKTKRRQNLNVHMQIHKRVDEIEMFTCDICSLRTKQKSSLKIHMLQHKTVDESEMFTCDVCEYKTKQNRNLKRHMLIHKNVDEIQFFSCDVCEYKTKYKSTLKKHTLIHKNVKTEIFL